MMKLTRRQLKTLIREFVDTDLQKTLIGDSIKEDAVEFALSCIPEQYRSYINNDLIQLAKAIVDNSSNPINESKNTPVRFKGLNLENFAIDKDGSKTSKLAFKNLDPDQGPADKWEVRENLRKAMIDHIETNGVIKLYTQLANTNITISEEGRKEGIAAMFDPTYGGTTRYPRPNEGAEVIAMLNMIGAMVFCFYLYSEVFPSDFYGRPRDAYNIVDQIMVEYGGNYALSVMFLFLIYFVMYVIYVKSAGKNVFDISVTDPSEFSYYENLYIERKSQELIEELANAKEIESIIRAELDRNPALQKHIEEQFLDTEIYDIELMQSTVDILDDHIDSMKDAEQKINDMISLKKRKQEITNQTRKEIDREMGKLNIDDASFKRSLEDIEDLGNAMRTVNKFKKNLELSKKRREDRSRD